MTEAIDIFSMAGKYLVPAISDQIFAEFPVMIERVQGSEGEYSPPFDAVVRHDYSGRTMWTTLRRCGQWS